MDENEDVHEDDEDDEDDKDGDDEDDDDENDAMMSSSNVASGSSQISSNAL